MTYNTGTATDYLDLLEDLVAVMTSRHLDEIAINAAGTGYVAGEVLGIDGTGATSTHVAQIEVLTVGGSGEITSARIYRGGAYTVDPTTTTGNSASGGSGSSATFDLTFAATGWSVLTRNEELDTVDSVAAGGSGYSVSDVLTLQGGVLAEGGAAATLTVSSVSSGAVTGVTITTRGEYEVFPTDPVGVSGGGGSGATFNLTPRNVTGDTIVVLEGDAGADDDPLVGIKTYSSETDETGVNTCYNWALFGMTSWGNLLRLDEQPNISPGFNLSAGDGTLTTSSSGDGAFVPLKTSDAFNIDYWISATGRRVVMIARVEGAATVYYAQASFGLLNQLGLTTEFPYPAYVAGSSDRKRVWYRDTLSLWGGLSDVIQRANGPFFVWAPEGAWLNAVAGDIASQQDLTVDYDADGTSPRCGVWPLGALSSSPSNDDLLFSIAPSTGFDNEDLTLSSGAIAIYRTPDTGGDLFPLYPVTVMQADGASSFWRIFGELDGVFWFHVADSGASSEDRIEQSSDAYFVSQNGTRVEDWSYLALRED